MDKERFRFIVGLLVPIIFGLMTFIATQILSNISDQHQAERDQAQLEATERTNDLLERQNGLAEEGLELDRQKIALLQSLNDSLEYLIDLTDDGVEGGNSLTGLPHCVNNAALGIDNPVEGTPDQVEAAVDAVPEGDDAQALDDADSKQDSDKEFQPPDPVPLS